MARKKKQEVTTGAFALSKISEDNQIDYSNPNVWNEFNKDNVKEKTDAKTKNRSKEIEKLYPKFVSKKIPLEKLIPANEQWNFFPEQNTDTMIELMKNIVVYGQLTPAIVWEQSNGKYMILGGHNRYAAVKKLNAIFTEAKDKEQADRFSVLDCNAYAYEELNEIEAQKIIIYDNIIRRENTTAIKAHAVINMAQLEKASRGARNHTVKRDRVLSIVAKAVGETEGSVKKLYQLRRLIPAFWALVDAKNTDDKITVQFARTIALLSEDLQKYILKNKLYKIKLSASRLNLLKAATTTEQVEDVYKNTKSRVFSSKIELDDVPFDNPASFIVPCPADKIGLYKEIIEYALCADNRIPGEIKDFIRQAMERSEEEQKQVNE